MSQPPLATSIIICTRDRAGALAETLASLAHVCVPADVPCELLIVDNGSTDGTARLAQECRLPNMPVRYLREERRGQCHARNAGIAAARGRVILFTDDDVRPPSDWVAGMAGPILRGEADAITGGVRLAPSLNRPWMEEFHRSWVASTEGIEPAHPSRMVGANMAFGRHVLGRVPAFDTELGPGALGFYDDTLFAKQLQTAGFRLLPRLDTVVEHHFDASRLTRATFLNMAVSFGRSKAYFEYHWNHADFSAPLPRILNRSVRLGLERKASPQQEGVSVSELQHVEHIALFRQYLKERRRPRRYEKHGLVMTHE